MSFVPFAFSIILVSFRFGFSLVCVFDSIRFRVAFKMRYFRFRLVVVSFRLVFVFILVSFSIS